MSPPAPVGGPTLTSMCFLLRHQAPTGRWIVSPKLAFIYTLGVSRRERGESKLTQRPGAVATRHGRVVVVLRSLGRLNPCTSYRPRRLISILFPFFHLPTLTISSTIVPANDLLTELPTRKGCVVVGAFPSLADAPATPPSLSTSASADDRRRVSGYRAQNGSSPWNRA